MNRFTEAKLTQGKLPNMSALRAFEAVVRHGGLKGAAAELAVTPSAVSHRIRQLESDLEIRLFRHEGRRLALTQAGERLAVPVRDGMAQLFHAVAEIKKTEAVRPLTISMLQNIAVNWFLPRLHRFRAAHPDIEVRLLLTAEHVDFSPDTADMGIRFSPRSWPGLYCRLLLHDRLAPLCSPQFQKRHGPFKSARDLLNFPLMASSTRRTDDWAAWFRRMGSEPQTLQQHTIMLDSTHLSLQAAANGIGFAIAGLGLAAPMINRNALVAPFKETISEWGKYYIVCPQDWANRDKIRQMRRWLIAEARGAVQGGDVT